MKRIFVGILALVLVLSMIPVRAVAAEKQVETFYLDDGSYMTVELITKGSRASGNVSGSKTTTYNNSSGTALWQVTLTGDFSYTGSGATCTSTAIDVTIFDSSWYTIYKTSGKSGNKATGSATIGKSVGGTAVTKVPVSLTITCDANGNLS